MERPLEDRTIVITRDSRQSKSLTGAIEALGGKAILFPTIALQEPTSWTGCDEALAQLQTYAWLIFTSANSVDYFYRRLERQKVGDVSSAVAAIGEKTAAAVLERGWKVDMIPERHSSDGLLQAFENLDLKGKRILLPASEIAREELPRGLAKRGALVDRVAVYRTVANRALDGGSMRTLIRQGRIDCLTFFSPSAFDNFIDIVDAAVIDDIKKSGIAIAAIGPTTAAAIRELSLDVAIEPEKSCEEDLVQALITFYSREN